MTSERRIASLEPFEPLPENEALRAEISLLWPYSSSSRSTALLLVDPDYRKRHDKGQIRVRFREAAANALARAHVGIGDVVYLELKGAKWQKKDDKALNLTPGKAVDAELLFDKKLSLVILEDGSGGLDGRKVVVDEGSPERIVGDVLSTPVRRSNVGTLGFTTPFSGGHGSPAYMHRLRLSAGTFLDSPGLIPTNDELDGGSARKKRRISYNEVRFTPSKATPARPNASREDEDEVDSVLNSVFNTAHTQRSSTVQDSEDPDVPDQTIDEIPESLATLPIVADTGMEEELPAGETMNGDDQHESNEVEDDRVEDTSTGRIPLSAPMPPPPLPALIMPPKAVQAGTARPTTPTLQPVSAAELPLPSPFPQTPLSRTPAVSTDTAAQAMYSRIAPPSYFDRTSTSPTKESGTATVTPVAVVKSSLPLSQVNKDPIILDEHIEGHASPSSGSEADVSSDEDVEAEESALDTSDAIAKQVESAINGGATTKATAQPALAFANLLAESSEIFSEDVSEDQVIDEEEEESLLGVDEPSDDEDLPLPSAEMLLDDNDYQLPELSELPVVNTGPATSMAEPNEGDSLGTRVSATADVHVLVQSKDTVKSETFKESVREASTTNESLPASQDDTDAAFAAMDTAMDSLNQGSLEKQQAPGPPLASTVAPHNTLLQAEQIVQVQTNAEGDLPNTEAAPVVQTIQPSAVVDHESQTNGNNNAEPATKTRFSLFELSERARQRSALSSKGELYALDGRERSPIEVVDMTDVEPDILRTTAQTRIGLLPSIADSAESPTTTLAGDNSRPPSRDAHHDVADHPQLSSLLEASQELSSTQVLHTNGSLSMFRKAEPQLEDIAEDDLDGQLLADLDANAEDAENIPPVAVKTKTVESTMTSPPRTTRRRLTTRLSTGTNALSSWFKAPEEPQSMDKSTRRKTTSAISPQRPPASTAPIPRERPKHPATSTSARTGSVSPPPLKRYSSSQGLRTSLTYLTPLTNLEIHLNNPSAKVDVMAVVSSSASAEDARRAKSGPRDWYTVFHVTDPAHLEQEEAHAADYSGEPNGKQANGRRLREDIRVEVFRPWKASLPVVGEGDVVLLRDFGVRSRGHRTYLLSGQDSAWCVFRDGGEDEGGEGKPAWARSMVSPGLLREEVRGPPVEVGAEEREKAGELRGWWDVVSMVNDKGKKRATL